MLIFTLRRAELHIGVAGYKYLTAVLAQFQSRVFIRYHKGKHHLNGKHQGKGQTDQFVAVIGAAIERRKRTIDEALERRKEIYERFERLQRLRSAGNAGAMSFIGLHWRCYSS